MDGHSLVRTADDFCRGLMSVTVDHSLGKHWKTYKLSGKIFMLVTGTEGNETVIVKADPIRAAVLRGQFEDITFPPRMGRRNWIAIIAGKTVTEAVLCREIKEAFQLVQATLPRGKHLKTGTEYLSRRELQPFARRLAATLPGVTHGRPFVEKLDVYKVVDKVFLVITDDPAEPVITLKTRPQDSAALCDRYISITPGSYFSKRHWLSLEGGKGITRELSEDLIRQSYRLALEKVPHNRRPAGLTETAGNDPH